MPPRAIYGTTVEQTQADFVRRFPHLAAGCQKLGDVADWRMINPKGHRTRGPPQ